MTENTNVAHYKVVEVWDYGPRIVVWDGDDEDAARAVCDAMQQRETSSRVHYEVVR